MFLFLFELLIMNDHNVSSSINFRSLEQSEDNQIKIKYQKKHTYSIARTAGVVVSWKIPILSTRVRFPGGVLSFMKFMGLLIAPNENILKL